MSIVGITWWPITPKQWALANAVEWVTNEGNGRLPAEIRTDDVRTGCASSRGVRAADARGVVNAGEQGAEGRRFREAAGVAHGRRACHPAPLHAQRREQGAAPAGRTGWFPGGWDVRQRHVETDPKAANAAILDDLTGGGTSVLLQIQAPGQAGISLRRRGTGAGAQGRLPQRLHHRARRAREHAGCRRQPARDLAHRRHQRERPARRLQL